MTIEAVDTRVRIGDGEVFARRWTPAQPSAGAPLVLLHDSLGSVEQWRDFPARLADASGRDVIAYDRIGFGRSSARTDRPSLDFIREEADVFAALADAWALPRFALLGYSVGGGMAVEIAAALPARCERVVTLSAQAFVEERTLEGIAHARELFAQPIAVERLQRWHPGGRARWMLDAWFEIWTDPAYRDWSLDAALARLRCPLLAIHGERDEYGSEAFPRRMVEQAGGPARMVLLEGIGHLPLRDAPDALLAQVIPFLREH